MKKIKKWTMCWGVVFGILLSALLISAPVYADSNERFNLKGTEYVLKPKYRYYSSGMYETTYELYVNSSAGQKKVAAIDAKQGNFWFAAVYKDKALFNWHSGSGEVKVYSYTVGQNRFKLLKNNLRIDFVKGKYAIGCIQLHTDVSASPLCVYNLKSGKTKKLGLGYSPVIMKGKLYYAKMNSNHTVMKIVRCKISGKNPKVLKTIKNKNGMYGAEVKKGYVSYWVPLGKGGVKREKVKFKL